MRADYDGGDGGRTDTSLSRRLLIALLTPVLLLLFAGGLLAFQIARMSEDAAWLDHSQLVIATAFEAQTQVNSRRARAPRTPWVAANGPVRRSGSPSAALSARPWQSPPAP